MNFTVLYPPSCTVILAVNKRSLEANFKHSLLSERMIVYLKLLVNEINLVARPFHISHILSFSKKMLKPLKDKIFTVANVSSGISGKCFVG